MLQKIYTLFKEDLPSSYRKGFEKYILIVNAEKISLISITVLFVYIPLCSINIRDIIDGSANNWSTVGTALAISQMTTGVFISIGLWFRYKISAIRKGELQPAKLMYVTLTGVSILFTLRSGFVYLDRESIMLYVFCLLLMHWLIYLSLFQRIFFTSTLILMMIVVIQLYDQNRVLMIEVVAVGLISFFSSLQYHQQTIKQYLSRCLIEEQRDLISLEKENSLPANDAFLDELNQNLNALEISLDAHRSNWKLNDFVKSTVTSGKNDVLIEVLFERLHPNFFYIISERYPELTPTDKRMIALIKMNLSTKEIATLLHISTSSANTARYRLRKKLKLSSEDSLEKSIQEM